MSPKIVLLSLLLARGLSKIAAPPEILKITPDFFVSQKLIGNQLSVIVEKKLPGSFCWGFGASVTSGDIFCLQFLGDDLTPTFSDCQLRAMKRPRCRSPSTLWRVKDSEILPTESRVLLERDIKSQPYFPISASSNSFIYLYSNSPKIDWQREASNSFGTKIIEMENSKKSRLLDETEQKKIFLPENIQDLVEKARSYEAKESSSAEILNKKENSIDSNSITSNSKSGQVDLNSSPSPPSESSSAFPVQVNAQNRQQTLAPAPGPVPIETTQQKTANENQTKVQKKVETFSQLQSIPRVSSTLISTSQYSPQPELISKQKNQTSSTLSQQIQNPLPKSSDQPQNQFKSDPTTPPTNPNLSSSTSQKPFIASSSVACKFTKGVCVPLRESILDTFGLMLFLAGMLSAF